MMKLLVIRAWYALVLTVLWAPALVLANDPGGGTNGVGPNVTLTDNGSTLTLANGILTAQITKDNAHITSLIYQGRQLVNGDIYFSMDGGDTYSQPSGCVFSIVTNTPDMVDISLFSLTNSRAQKFNIDVHYVLRRGDSGLYAYAVLDHPAGYPDTGVGEWRMVWKMNQDPTERIYVDDIRNWQKPSAYDLSQAEATPVAEIVKLTTGLWAGRYTCKYMYSVEYEDVGCYGHASDINKFGVWAVFGGFDYFNDGPTKQDLAPADGIIHIHFGRNHYNASSTTVTNGEAWTKMYGPWLLYCNTNSGGGDACWADAKAQVAAEQTAWPYGWLTGNSNYPAATGRGAVSGQFVVNDPLKPGLTVSTNAWIGLAQPDPGKHWQFESKRYQYWVHPDAAGNFVIPHVRPGTFTLYAFTPGAVGEYSLGDVTVTAGATNALGTCTWTVPHASDRLVWEIGIPDRTAREFRFGTNYWEPYLWEQYSNVFSNPLEYTVGTSNWTNDWNYAHSGYLNGGTWEPWKWNIHYQLTNRPAVGDAKLTLAWASAHYAAVQVFVDETTYLGEVGPTCYGGPTGGNALIREGIHAKYGVNTFSFPAALLREGSNTLTLFQRSWNGSANHVMYDYVNLEVPNVPSPPPGRNLTWKGGVSANAWDVNVTLNWLEGATTTRFQQGDQVTFNDSGNNSVPITLSGSLLPGVVVVNASKNYAFSGGGWLQGLIPLVKSGSGTLTLNSSNALGGGITVNAGTLQLASDSANSQLTGDITLNGGTFSMYDNINTYNSAYWNLIVPAGATATFNADGRCDWYGRLTGGGTLNLNVKYVRTALRGNWSGFTGQLNVTTDSDGGELRFYNEAGVPAGAVHLNDKVTACFALAGSAAVPIGELTGSTGSVLASSDTAGSGPITWQVGGRNTDATFAGVIKDRQGAAAIEKVGAGTWTLTGSNTYSGATWVSAGTLRVNGNQSAATGPVTVQAGATLEGDGTLGGAAAISGTLAPGTSIGRITFGSNLTLNAGSTTVVEVSKSPFTNDVIRVLGGLSYGGTLTVLTSGTGFAAGDTFQIFDAAVYPTTGFNTLQLPVLPAGLAWDASGLTNNGSIAIVGVPVPKDLVWRGDGAANVWDLAATPNWRSGTNLSVFTNIDTVTFDDTGSNQVPVNLVGILSPVAMTVDATNRYTLGGPGWLSGSMLLTKAGTGTLIVNTTNAFSGGATLTAGTVVLGNGSALGGGLVGLNGGTLQLHRNGALANAMQVAASSTVANDGNCTLNGSLVGSNVLSLVITSGNVITLGGNASAFSGTISLGTSPGILRFNQGANPWGAANATFDAGTVGIINNRFTGGGTVYLGALEGGAGSKLRGSDQASNPGSLNTYVVGGTGRDATFAGSILNTAHFVGITKLGSGVWTLSGTNAYSGPTRVGQGTLALAGAITTTNSVVVSNTATLHLTGTLSASLAHVQAGGTLTGCGTLNATLVNDGLVLGNCGAPGVLTLTGSVTNNGTMRLVGGTALASTNLFVNNGVLDLLTAGSGLPPNLVNNGVVLDSSNLPVQMIAVTPTSVRIQVQSYSGHQYQLQRASSLSSPDWMSVGIAQPGINGLIEFTDPDSTAGARFYRIKVWP